MQYGSYPNKDTYQNITPVTNANQFFEGDKGKK